MSYRSLNNQIVVVHECNGVRYRFAIALEDFKRFDSNTSQYFLICRAVNKGYLIPFGIIKKYLNVFNGKETRFPLAIDPKKDQIVYKGSEEDISIYSKLGKKEIESIMLKLDKF